MQGLLHHKEPNQWQAREQWGAYFTAAGRKSISSLLYMPNGASRGQWD